MFRETTIKDIFFDSLGNAFVTPKPFVSNTDSTIESGIWSFWFDKLTCIDAWFDVIVESDFEPCAEGVMTWRIKNYPTKGCVFEGKIREFVTSKPQRVSCFWFRSDYDFAETSKEFLIRDQYGNVWGNGKILGKISDYGDGAEEDIELRLSRIGLNYKLLDSVHDIKLSARSETRLIE